MRGRICKVRGYWGGAEPPAPVQNKAAASGQRGARMACVKGQTGAHLLALTSSRQLILKEECVMQTTEVELVFRNADGKKKTYNIVDPKDGLTKAEAEKAAGEIIAANIFNVGGADLKSLYASRLRTTNLVNLA